MLFFCAKETTQGFDEIIVVVDGRARARDHQQIEKQQNPIIYNISLVWSAQDVDKIQYIVSLIVGDHYQTKGSLV